MRFLTALTITVAMILLQGCAGLGDNGQLLPAESRATPELALLNQQAQLADAGGEAAKAEALYKAVLRKTPNDAETWFRLGNLYANNNHPNEAAIAYERTLIADNSHTRAWHNLSVIRLRQAYAAMLQAQITVNADDPLATSIDQSLEEMSKLSPLGTQPPPTSKARRVTTAPAAAEPPRQAQPKP